MYNRASLLIRLFFALLVGLLTSNLQAGIPVWTFEPLTATTVIVPFNSTAVVQYRVTNQSTRPHTLEMIPMTGVSQVTVGVGICGNPFVLPSRGSSCILSLLVNGSQLATPINDGPIVCQIGSRLECYRPGPANILRLSSSFIISPTSGPTIGGTGVTITGSNLSGTTSVLFGGIAATNVHVVNETTVTAVTPAHPAGVVDVTVVTPTANLTLPNGYTYVVAVVGQPSGGGVIACLDGGLNNVIAATADASTNIEWGGEGTFIGTNDIDGATNTLSIVTTLGNNGGTPYAAQLCSNYEIDSQGNTPCQAGNACYNDWFLPATDQLTCMFPNGAAIGGFTPAAFYWSSSEGGFTPANDAFAFMVIGGGGNNIAKSTTLYVRCTRTFT